MLIAHRVARRDDEQPARFRERTRWESLEDCLLMPIANSVRLACVVEWFPDTEKSSPTFVLTPRADYSHDRPRRLRSTRLRGPDVFAWSVATMPNLCRRAVG
jgi:hypothetical protein